MHKIVSYLSKLILRHGLNSVRAVKSPAKL